MRDETPVWSGDDAIEVAGYLEWAACSAAIAHLQDHYLLHAGAVAINGQGVLLSGASGSGKSTLVAGLVAAGARYFSDEVAVLEPTTNHLLPFAKSLYIRAGARVELTALYPELARMAPHHRQPDDEQVWLLSIPDRQLPTVGAPVRYVILPEFRAGVPGTVRRIKRSDALQSLIKQSFNLYHHGGRGVGALVKVLSESECYSLTFDSVNQAMRTVLDIVAAGADEQAVSRGGPLPSVAG